MKNEVGFVYVISNPSMPGLVKVGMTQTSPGQRAEELVSTGVPSKFQIDYFCVVYNPFELEKSVHIVLGKHRARGEWFGVSAFEAIAAIQNAGHKLLDQFWNEDLKNRVEIEELEDNNVLKNKKTDIFRRQKNAALKFLHNDALKEIITTAAQSAGRGLAEVFLEKIRSSHFKKKK